MTTYAYTLTLNDAGYIATRDAIDFYIHHCRERIAKNEAVPYWAHLEALCKVEEDLKQAKSSLTSAVVSG